MSGPVSAPSRRKFLAIAAMGLASRSTLVGGNALAHQPKDPPFHISLAEWSLHRKMMRIVLDAGYRGYVGIEYEGKTLDEYAGITATHRLFVKVRESMT